MEERWRDVPGFDGYQVSDLGRVKNRRGHILKPYYYNDLRKKAPVVQFIMHFSDGSVRNTHRSLAGVVLAAFVGPGPSYRTQIGYKDGNLSNCRLDNLYYTRVDEETHSSVQVVKVEADEDGVIELWKAVCNEVIKDLYYLENPRSNEDLIRGADAKAFLRSSYWFYVGEEPDSVTLKEVADRVKEYMRGPKAKKQKTAPKPVDTRYKKRCLTCIYSWMDADRSNLTSSTAHLHVYCEYILKTGHRRPCQGENCTAYKRKGKKNG